MTNSDQNKKDNTNDLDALINQEFGGSRVSHRKLDNSKTIKTESIEQINYYSNASTQSQIDSKEAKTETCSNNNDEITNSTDIENIVHQKTSKSNNKINQTEPKHIDNKQELERELKELHSKQDDIIAQEPIHKDRNKLSTQVILAILIIALLITITISISVISKSHDSLTSIATDLSNEIDTYYQLHKKLPETLTSLPSFPKDGVEWPIKYWKARHLNDVHEIFWIPTKGKKYWIFIRKGNDLVIKSFDTPLQKMKINS